MDFDEKMIAGVFLGFLLLGLTLLGGMFYSVSLDAKTSQVCIEQGHEWIDGNCVKLSRD